MSSSNDSPLWAKLVAWPIVFMLFHCCGYAMSEGPTQTQLSAEQLGYRDVKIGEAKLFADWRGCGFGDYRGYSMQATNAAGEQSPSLVCCGVFSGCYVRAGDEP